jgi:hypothetical protein
MSNAIETETSNNNVHSSTPSKSSDLPPLVTDRPPRVLISGAGLGGLFLGILLERAGIPYEIFERSAELRPLGKQSNLPFAKMSVSGARGQTTRLMPVSLICSPFLFATMALLPTGAIMSLVRDMNYVSYFSIKLEGKRKKSTELFLSPNIINPFFFFATKVTQHSSCL